MDEGQGTLYVTGVAGVAGSHLSAKLDPAPQVGGWVSWKAGQWPAERECSSGERVVVALGPVCHGDPTNLGAKSSC